MKIIYENNFIALHRARDTLFSILPLILASILKNKYQPGELVIPVILVLLGGMLCGAGYPAEKYVRRIVLCDNHVEIYSEWNEKFILEHEKYNLDLYGEPVHIAAFRIP